MSERPRIAIVCRDLELAWFRMRRSVDELLSHQIQIALVAPEGDGAERWRDGGYDVRTYAHPPRGSAALALPVLAPQLIEFEPQVVLVADDADLLSSLLAAELAAVRGVIAMVDRPPALLRNLERVPDATNLAELLPSREEGIWAKVLEKLPALRRFDRSLRFAVGRGVAKAVSLQGLQLVKAWLVTSRRHLADFEGTRPHSAGRVHAHDQGFGIELDIYGDLADDPAARARARQALGIDPSRVVIAAVLHNARTPATTSRMLRLLSAISDRVPSLHLMLAGGRLERQSDIALVDRLASEGRATIAPLLEERADVYAAADIFVGDGELAHFTMEAAAAGLPAVVADDASWQEVVRHGESGLRLDFDDLDGVVAQVRTLCDNAERRFAMSRAARHRAIRVFDDVLMRRRLVRVLDRVFAELAGQQLPPDEAEREPARELRSVSDLLERG